MSYICSLPVNKNHSSSKGRACEIILIRSYAYIVFVIHMFFFRERNFKWVSGVSIKPSFNISWVVHMSSPVNGKNPPFLRGSMMDGPRPSREFVSKKDK